MNRRAFFGAIAVAAAVPSVAARPADAVSGTWTVGPDRRISAATVRGEYANVRVFIDGKEIARCVARELPEPLGVTGVHAG